MERARPMDRLVCGDVGYGKTEVALRAAFKAVMDRQQVAVLVPTTVLAQQHFNTFSERLALSRARRDAQPLPLGEGAEGDARATWRRARSTSSSARTACSQKDVDFKDLGLLVIDEEQRFGVAHKERLSRCAPRWTC